ncbi:Uncharacterised protein [Bacillus freudenreichii]|nr:Uncharacterised protein [Bacillus freudenreichii]
MSKKMDKMKKYDRMYGTARSQVIQSTNFQKKMEGPEC